jgi:hypothetical protein
MNDVEKLEQQLQGLRGKLDHLTEGAYATAMAEQAALADLRNQLTSLEHLFGCLNEQVERNRYQVWGNPSGGLVDRVAKLEFEALRLAEQRKRNLAAIWTCIGGVVLYLFTTLLGKLL